MTDTKLDAARIEEMLADARSEVARVFRDETVYDFEPEEIVVALTELLALRALSAPEPVALDRDSLGRRVREAWVKWAKTQPNPKPSWLVPYDQLSEPDKEADRQIGEALASPPNMSVEENGKAVDEEDLASDERWNLGVNYAIERLCEILGVDPKSISWDAATETLNGDVMSVICNVLVAAYGEEWSSNERETAAIRAALSPANPLRGVKALEEFLIRFAEKVGPLFVEDIHEAFANLPPALKPVEPAGISEEMVERLHRLRKALNRAEAFATVYEFDSDEGSHSPSDLERLLMLDMLNGLFDDEAFVAALNGAVS